MGYAETYNSENESLKLPVLFFIIVMDSGSLKRSCTHVLPHLRIKKFRIMGTKETFIGLEAPAPKNNTQSVFTCHLKMVPISVSRSPAVRLRILNG